MPQTFEERLAAIDAKIKAGQGGGAPAPAPAPASAPDTATPGVFGTLLDYLGRPAAATSGAVLALQKHEDPIDAISAALTGGPKTSFRDVLEEAGMPEGKMRGALGFAADVVLDPTNLIPIGGLGQKAVKAGIAGLHGAQALLPKLGPLGRIANAVGEAVTPYYGLARVSPAVRQAAVLRDSALVAAKHNALTDSINTFAPLLPKGNPAEATRLMDLAQRTAEAGSRHSDPAVQAIADALLEHGTARAAKEAPMGVLGTQRPNYVPRLYVEGPTVPTARNPLGKIGRPSFQKPRSFDTPAEAEAAGFVRDTNLIRTTATRAKAGEEALIHRQFTDDLLNKPEFADIRADAAVAPKHWLKVQPTAAIPQALTAQLEHLRFEPQVAKDFQKMFLTPAKTGEVMQAFDEIQGVWKGAVTAGIGVPRAAFNERNLLSNIWLSVAGDMSPLAVAARYRDALPILVNKAPTVTRIGKYSGQEILDASSRLGVTGVEFGAAGEFGDAAQKAFSKATAGASKAAAMGIADFPRAVAGNIENLSRMALFLDQLHKGKSLEQAAAHTHKWLINYASATDAERNLKRLVPFYMWARRSVPLIIEGTLKHPELVSVQAKYRSWRESEVPEGDRVPMADRPAWMQQGASFQMPSEKGVEKYGNFGLPGEDLNILPVPGHGQEALQNLLGRLTPAKAIFEAGLNRNFQTGAPIHGGNSWTNPIPAAGLLQMIAAASPTVAKSALGMGKKQGEWQAPAVLSHVVRSLTPSIVESAGKALNAPPPQRTPPAPAGRNFVLLPSVAHDTPLARAKRKQAKLAELLAQRQWDAQRQGE